MMKWKKHTCESCHKTFEFPDDGKDERCSVCKRLLCEECWMGDGFLEPIDVCCRCQQDGKQ
jgi:hypothetical protein